MEPPSTSGGCASRSYCPKTTFAGQYDTVCVGRSHARVRTAALFSDHFGAPFVWYFLLPRFHGHRVHHWCRGDAVRPGRRRWGRGEPADGLGSAASPRTHRWCWVQPLYGRARARCVSMRPPAAPCLHTPREATVTLEVPRKGCFRVRARARTGCARVCCAFEHTVSYGGAKVVSGQYEQLAPPPEVFGGSIPSHWPIIMM